MDQIVTKIVLTAGRARVWRAISDASEFGTWFGVRFDGSFVAGSRVTGAITPTKVDPEVAEAQKAYEGARFEIVIETVEPERLFTFRWHPFAVDPARDYSSEPKTLVAFHLESVPEGVLLTLTESGFDQIPSDRRAQALAANEGGWEAQMHLIQKFLLAEPE